MLSIVLKPLYRANRYLAICLFLLAETDIVESARHFYLYGVGIFCPCSIVEGLCYQLFACIFLLTVFHVNSSVAFSRFPMRTSLSLSLLEYAN